MTFQKNKLYTHKKMLDSIIQIVNTKEVKDGIKAHVIWFTKSELFMGEDIVLIKKSEFENWYEWTN